MPSDITEEVTTYAYAFFSLYECACFFVYCSQPYHKLIITFDGSL